MLVTEVHKNGTAKAARAFAYRRAGGLTNSADVRET